MPTIHVELFEGRTDEQKRDFARLVTREGSRILNAPPEDFDIIFVEVARQNWATAGQLHSDPEGAAES
nr:4-oxalocrotonate tautomerase [Bosea sp. 117]